MDWKRESEMFNQMADYYDAFRPDYPSDVIAAIIDRAGLTAGSKILEIGSGSGKATEQFSGRGFEMHCIDPGENLVKRGRERFKDENITFTVSRFEDYDAPREYYDAIISAQAFHWIPQPEGYEKCAKALKRGGLLAIFWNIEMGSGSEIDAAVLEIARKYNAFTAFMPEAADYEKRVAEKTSEIENSGLFAKPELIQSYRDKAYTGEEYFGYLMTGNVFIQQPESIKQACREEVMALAERHGGIRRRLVCELYMARRL